jgi:hypothetical protein
MAARKGHALRARLCVKTLDAKRRALAGIPRLFFAFVQAARRADEELSLA